jgi:hypothetical protein
MTAMSSHGIWRRTLSCALAYALVIQGFVFAAGIAAPAIGASDAATWSGFELCQHGGTGSPAVPAKAPDDNCCVYCTIGGLYVASAPPSTPQYDIADFTTAAWRHAAPRLVTLLVYGSAWPRGPPSAA